MIIEEKSNKIKFKDVEVRQCFKSNYDVYIKTNGDLENNVVCLNDGNLWFVRDNADVILINAKVVME